MATTYSPTRSASLDPSEVDGQVVRRVFELEHGNVEPDVLADDLRAVLAVVRQLDLHEIGVVDNVRVRHDVALRVDQEARAQRLLLLDGVALSFTRLAAGQAAPVALVEEREQIAEAREPEVPARHVHLVHGGDVHDGGSHPGGQGGDVRCAGEDRGGRERRGRLRDGFRLGGRGRRMLAAGTGREGGEEGERSERDELSRGHGLGATRAAREGFPAGAAGLFPGSVLSTAGQFSSVAYTTSPSRASSSAAAARSAATAAASVSRSGKRQRV